MAGHPQQVLLVLQRQHLQQQLSDLHTSVRRLSGIVGVAGDATALQQQDQEQ